MRTLRILILDVDGTLTDGKIYMSAGGELFKSFNVKDGLGIKEILPELNIVPVILTGRKSRILEERCEELNIRHLYQNVSQKFEKLQEILEIPDLKKQGITLQQVGYVGDDRNDLECIRKIKSSGGVVGCPKDAIDEIKNIADFVSEKNGGEGAVRDFIDWLCDQNQKRERI